MFFLKQKNVALDTENLQLSNSQTHATSEKHVISQADTGRCNISMQIGIHYETNAITSALFESFLKTLISAKDISLRLGRGKDNRAHGARYTGKGKG